LSASRRRSNSGPAGDALHLLKEVLEVGDDAEHGGGLIRGDALKALLD
jgi:hypothetical protein